MIITIYQVNMDRDINRAAFESLEGLEMYQGSAAIDSALYDRVYEGDVECSNLEEVYQMFNLNHPKDYLGRSMSVSDVVEVTYTDGSSKFFFCDSVGFKEVRFQPELTGRIEDERMRVVLLEPGKAARVTYIGTSLAAKQAVVGGDIEVVYPFEDEVCIVCNEEAKLEGRQLNRAIREGEKVVNMSYGDLTARFRDAERDGSGKHLTGYIVFTEDSFSESYPEEARTYVVSSNNKAFQPNKGGYSIYASALDGSDPMVRIERYMAAEKGGGDGWKIERCYVKEVSREILDVIAGTCFVCGIGEENLVGLTEDQAKKYEELFRLPEQFFINGGSIEAIPYKPKDKSQDR